MRDLGEEEARRRAADLAASYEHAIVEALILRVERALAAEPGARLALGGGVAANARCASAPRGSASSSRCRRASSAPTTPR